MTIKLWILAATVLTIGVIFPTVVYWLTARAIDKGRRERDPFRKQVDR